MPRETPIASLRAGVMMIVRAMPLLVGALVITFTQEHTPLFGLFMAGAVFLLYGLLLGLSAYSAPPKAAYRISLAEAAVTIIAGGTGIALFVSLGEGASAISLIALFAGWAIVAGVLDLIAAFKARRLGFAVKSAFLPGIITLVFALLVAIVPPDLRIEYGGEQQVSGALTASTQAVGLMGAYFAILGVYLIIEGISHRVNGPAVAITDPAGQEPDVTEATV